MLRLRLFLKVLPLLVVPLLHLLRLLLVLLFSLVQSARTCRKRAKQKRSFICGKRTLSSMRRPIKTQLCIP